MIRTRRPGTVWLKTRAASGLKDFDILLSEAIDRAPIGELVDIDDVGLTAAYIEWDLTAYVQAQKTAGASAISIEVKQDVPNNETPTSFNSKENASNKPQLVVTGS